MKGLAAKMEVMNCSLILHEDDLLDLQESSMAGMQPQQAVGSGIDENAAAAAGRGLPCEEEAELAADASATGGLFASWGLRDSDAAAADPQTLGDLDMDAGPASGADAQLPDAAGAGVRDNTLSNRPRAAGRWATAVAAARLVTALSSPSAVAARAARGGGGAVPAVRARRASMVITHNPLALMGKRGEHWLCSFLQLPGSY